MNWNLIGVNLNIYRIFKKYFSEFLDGFSTFFREKIFKKIRKIEINF